MKKTLVFLLLIALSFSLTLVACKTDEDVVSITPETLQLEVGAEVNWNGHVTVKINDEVVANPQISWTLIEGDEKQAGMCRYTITYVHNDAEYTRDGIVNFVNVNINILTTDQSLKIGDEVSWNNNVQVYVNGVLQANPQITWTITNGNPNVEGVCAYRITFTYNGKPYTATAKINFNSGDKPDNSAVRLQAISGTPNVVIGEQIDWTDYVTVYVNDQVVSNPELSATLVEGDEGEEGICVYDVSYEHEGKTTTVQVRVRYDLPVSDEKVVSMSINQRVFSVGEQIDWNAVVTVYVDNLLVTNPVLSAELKSGNPSVDGEECTYTVTLTLDDGATSSKDFVVRYFNEPVNPTDVTLLQTLFAKDYDSYTFVYNYYEVGNEQYYMRETDKVVYGATSLWQVNYEDVNISSSGSGTVTSHFDYYLTVNSAADLIRVYLEYGSGDESEWKYSNYSSDQIESFYLYLPMAFTFHDVSADLSYKWFVKEDDTHYAANSVFLQEIAEVLFGVNENETYTSIVIITDGNNITGVRAEYTTRDTVIDQQTGESTQVVIESVIELTWSDFDETTVTLPQATEYVPTDEREVPEYVNPTTAEDLTAEQQTALTEALNKTYESISLIYSNDKGEMNYYYEGKFMLTPTLSYSFNRELAQYKDWVISDETQEIYCKKLNALTCDVWLIVSENGDFIKYPSYAATLTSFTSYILVKDFNLTADMFGYVDGVYVIKPGKIDELKAKFDAVIDLSELTKCDVLSFTIKLDDDGNVIEWRLVADCATDSDSFYWDLTYAYCDFDSTTVTLPDTSLDSLQAVTPEQTEKLNAALGADYSNVTIDDLVNKFTMYFAGEDVMVIGYDDNGAPVTDVYKVRGGKYYEILGGNEVEITKAEFDYYVLSFGFAQIDVSKVKYDTEKNVYYISAADVNVDEFALYYKDFFNTDEETVEIDGFAFVIENGRVVSVTTYFGGGDMVVSATLSNFGTTTVQQQNPDEGSAEE